MYLRAVSAGKKEAYRQIKVHFEFYERIAPLFDPPLELKTLKVDQEDVENGVVAQMYEFTSS